MGFVYTAIQLCYWSGGCIALGFATAILQQLGYDNGAVGLITSFSSVLGFALTLAVSRQIDRRGGSSAVNWMAVLAVVQAGLLAPILLGIFPALCYTVYMGLTLSMSSVVSKLYMDLTHAGIRVRFSLARGIGSAGYAVTSLCAGRLMDRLHGTGLLLLGSGLFLISALLALGLRSRLAMEPPAPAPTQGGWKRGLLDAAPGFALLILGISLVSAANKTVTVFLVNIVRSVQGDMATFGMLSGYLAVLEVPVILLFPRLRRKFSLPALLLCSMLFYTLKIAGFAMADSVTALLAASSLHIFSTGIFQPASVEYVRETIPHRYTATAQGLMTGLPMLVSFAATSLFGILLDWGSVRSNLIILALLALCGTLLCRTAMNQKGGNQNG